MRTFVVVILLIVGIWYWNVEDFEPGLGGDVKSILGFAKKVADGAYDVNGYPAVFVGYERLRQANIKGVKRELKKLAGQLGK